MGVKELLKQKQEQLVGETLKFPLTKIQIDQSQGKFRIGGSRNEEGEWEGAEYVDELQMVILKKFGEYFYFNPETEKVEKRSTIEENPAECKELISRVPIAELKEANYQFTFVSHLIGLKLNGEAIPADLVLKGSGVKAFIDFTTEHRDYWKNRLLNKLIIKLEKRKKGAVSYYVPIFEVTEVSDEEAKMVLENMDAILDDFEEFRKKYNNRKQTKAEEIAEETEVETEDYEEDLPF